MASGSSLVGRQSRRIYNSQLKSVGASKRRRAPGGSSSDSIALASFADDTETDGVPQLETGFLNVSYSEIESLEREEFRDLLKKESSWKRSCLHKGLLSNLIFLCIFVVGVVIVQIKFPLEGPQGFENFGQEGLFNESQCGKELGLCFFFRAVRSIGLFGLAAGVINWIFIELLFRKIVCICGSGVIINRYQDIQNGLRDVILNIIFNSNQLQAYFSGKDQKLQKMLKLESHVAGLLSSRASITIINEKIEQIFNSPQGFTLLQMGVDKEQFKQLILKKVKHLISDISPTIYKRLKVPGIMDGEELKDELENILAPKIDQLMPEDINNIIALMLRKHLSWLIIWGNVFGTIAGILNEIIIISTILFSNNHTALNF